MLLDRINSPQDLKGLNIEQLPLLAEEIRQRIIEVVSRTGGHLSSSLGAVELITALHYCLDTPRDRIVFDVGHQAYAHKIITARNPSFHTLRQYQGVSGFPSREESVYDTFTTGHSSTAVSLALGLACARDYLSPEEYFRVVAVIGDGSLSGGLCFEGLNNAGHLKKDLLVVLNTNDLSIAPNVGALSNYLNKIISQPLYNRFKRSLEAFLKSRLHRESRIIRLANKFEEGLKGLFIPGMLFEELGFRYFGPLDGHNISLLVHTLKNILAIKGPLLLHVVTKKGKGYVPAESEPVRLHGTAPFDIDTGLPKPGEAASFPTYTQVFSRKLIDLAGRDRRLVALTAAMPEGTGLDKFRDLYPQRFFDVGIAEEHAVAFAAGLARAGVKPVVAVYSTFLQRAYDQLLECVALQNLGVVFILDRAGIVGEDGVTHQGIFDLAYLRNIPNFIIMAPKDGRELEAMLEFAVQSTQPIAIRYPKGKTPPADQGLPLKAISLAQAEVLKDSGDVAIFALGSMVYPSLAAAQILNKHGIEASVVNSRFVKPLDVATLSRLSASARFVFTVEEGILDGGFGSAVSEAIDLPVHRIALPCAFIPHGPRDVLLKRYRLTAEGIAEQIKEIMARYT